MTEQTSDQAAALLHRVFETLDEWRHLPAYQLERRVDVLFGLLLPEIVEAEFGLTRENLVVVPEFPLHKGLLNLSNKGKKDNQSVKVDFAVFCRDQNNKRLLLVILKTDNKSIDFDQLTGMEIAKTAGVKTLLRGVVECARHSKELRKYAQLIWKLNKIGCINVSERFRRMDMTRDKPGLTGNFDRLGDNFDSHVCDSWSTAKIELALIYPGDKMKTRSTKGQEVLADPLSRLRLVDFARVAQIVGESPLSPFQERWAKCEAGRVNPWAE